MSPLNLPREKVPHVLSWPESPFTFHPSPVFAAEQLQIRPIPTPSVPLLKSDEKVTRSDVEKASKICYETSESKDNEESLAQATTKSSNTMEVPLIRKDVVSKTVIRALKRFISDHFERYSGYLRLPRHKRVPKFMGMGERFIFEKLQKYTQALENVGISI